MRQHVHIQQNQIPAGVNAVISIFIPGTTVLIPDTVYADATSATTLGNPYTHPGGNISFYLATDRKVDIGVKMASEGSLIRPSVTVPVSEQVYSYGTMKSGGQVTGWIVK